MVATGKLGLFSYILDICLTFERREAQTMLLLTQLSTRFPAFGTSNSRLTWPQLLHTKTFFQVKRQNFFVTPAAWPTHHAVKLWLGRYLNSHKPYPKDKYVVKGLDIYYYMCIIVPMDCLKSGNAQLNKFRDLLTWTGCNMVDNYRPTQLLGTRTVDYYRPPLTG